MTSNHNQQPEGGNRGQIKPAGGEGQAGQVKPVDTTNVVRPPAPGGSGGGSGK